MGCATAGEAGHSSGTTFLSSTLENVEVLGFTGFVDNVCWPREALKSWYDAVEHRRIYTTRILSLHSEGEIIFGRYIAK